jgi:hypothetical protein
MALDQPQSDPQLRSGDAARGAQNNNVVFSEDEPLQPGPAIVRSGLIPEVREEFESDDPAFANGNGNGNSSSNNNNLGKSTSGNG